MRGWFIKAVFVAMGLILVAAGCAPKPAEEGKQEIVSPAEEGKQEIVNLEIYCSPMGTPVYQSAIILSEMLNELHPWIKASPIETLGAVDALTTSSHLRPERRKYALHINISNMDLTKSWGGFEPYKRKYTDLKVLGRYIASGFGFATYDSEIKTPQDLIGKRIGMSPRGSSPTELCTALLKDSWGIYDKVTLSHHSPPGFKDIITSGAADVLGTLFITEAKGEGNAGTAPYVLDVIGARQTYWINVTQEDIDRVNEKHPWTAFRMVGSKGCLGGDDDPPEDTGSIAIWTPLTAFAEFDDEIAYELIKFLVDNAEEWTSRTLGQDMGPEYLTTLPGLTTEESIHPGALRYYKEQGIEIRR